MKASLLDQLPLVSSTRRNHALEHATMTILSMRIPGVRMAGVSNPTGFYLISDLPTELVTDAVLEAQRRLNQGESSLAIHPHCGTNLVTSVGVAAGAAGLILFATAWGKKPRWYSYILAALAAVPAFFMAKPLGPRVQKTITTSSDLDGMKVILVTSQKAGNNFIHRISTSA